MKIPLLLFLRNGGEGTFTAAAIKSEREREREVKEQRDQGKKITTMKITHAPQNERGKHPFILCGSYGSLESLSKHDVDGTENVI